MKKILLLLAVSVVALQSVAATVDRVTAQQKAETFLKARATQNGKLMASSPIKIVSERTITNSANVNVPVFYIFNTQDHFIIVSGEDRGEQILAYGDAPVDFNIIPANMQTWLNFYKKQIEFLQDRPGLVVKTMSQSLKAPSRAQNVSPLLAAKWNQTSPYYDQCIINGTQCLTGCPATSLAQVFYYWKYPTEPTGVVPAYRYRESYYSSWTNVPALPSTTFAWANMKNTYTFGGTTAQKQAVATLMRYVGQAEHMAYGAEGSGISSDSTVLIANACKFFGYDSNVRAIKKTNYYGSTYYNDTQWANLIQGELAAGHPIVYCAISDEGSGGGHAFNIDGYTVSSNQYHINWGWGGAGDGDFSLNAFTDYEGWTFDIYQQMVIGIQPPGGQVTFPVINVEPESLDFGTTRVGETITRTFHVSGTNLLGDITFTRSGNGNYSVSPASLTAAEVEAGADITVTYAPQTSGTHNATILVEGGAAESCSVSCTGVAQAVPTITATPNELSFNASVGESVTGTFNLRGTSLTGAVYLKVVNSTGGFSINKSNVTKNAATSGVDVTVTYNPTTPGNHTAQVMLRSSGADTVYVNLSGTASVTTYAPVMQPANPDYVTSTSFRADWTDQTMAAAVASYTLQYSGNGTTSNVTDITNKYYTLENLTAGAMYSYKVKAYYVDGTESAWSNIEQVTLPQGHNYGIGDVNHDGNVAIGDVSALIDYLLGSGNSICTICADVNGDTTISIADVSALIDMLLN